MWIAIFVFFFFFNKRFFFLEVGNVILLECPSVLFRIYGFFWTKKLRILNKGSPLNSMNIWIIYIYIYIIGKTEKKSN